MDATATDWYWLDGSAYCPACVSCDTPAIDAADATRGPCVAGKCACCGTTETQSALSEIESHLGASLCTDANPCGALAYYDAGEDRPWRIADDQTEARYATFADAVVGAKEWADAMS